MSQNEGRQDALDLLLSIGETEHLTRQASDVVQIEGQPFRGLKNLLILPFTTNGNTVNIDDVPDIPTVIGGEGEKVIDKNYYFFNQCHLMRGTDRVLVWGCSKPVSRTDALTENGKLETTLEGRMLLKDITFNLKPIRETTDVHADAQVLADYMTAIANTEGWSTTNDEQMKSLYLDFIHAESEGTGLMAGSAAHVRAFVAALRTQLEAIGGELCTAIIANIDANSSIENNTYPASIGLPDGAAALRWTGTAFSVRTTTTTLDNINGITRYTYPAELWYFVDSPIRTSTHKVEITEYETSEWANLLNNNYQGGPTINASTQSVAVEKPLEYGVGRLELTLTSVASQVKDAKNNIVTNATAANLPLKAVIIGGQHIVGFDFKPQGEQSDVDARFIYDPIVGNTGTVNTLVLQSYDGEKIPIVLEFENKTEQQFAGKDGIIYPDTKFYLIAQIDPAKGTGDDSVEGRVFTQDHTTAISTKVTSLKNAYSCMPDLLEPRLEIGVEVTTSWIQSTTTTVIL